MAACGVWADDTDSALLARQAAFDSFAAEHRQERVYLHFDNTSYYKGERMWYKAYVVDGDDFRATPLSRILYVELLNPMGYPVETQKLVIKNGQADGAFLLADTINAGFYEVRAYTAWMLNFTTGDHHGWQRLTRRDARQRYGERLQRYLEGNAGVFSRVFPVYEAVDSGRYALKRMPRLPKATASLAEPERERLVMDFYPEGGNLVEGVPTRIAFQARSSEGRTLNVAGALMRRGDSIGYFKTEYAGRGVFAVTADETLGEELTDRLKLRLTYRGRDYTFDLPGARRRGYVLNVFQTDSAVRATVARNDRTEGMRLGLSVTCRGRTAYSGVIDLRGDLSATVAIGKEMLRTGVNIVTLYTAEGKVVAQRMVFVNNHDIGAYRLTASVAAADGDSLRPYGRVAVDCRVTDSRGNAVADSLTFAMAVTDGDTRDGTYADGNVLTYLLLSSEIKGFVPHPAYYFETDDVEHRAALDVLLMVQGWTRYDFERMMSGREFRPMPEAERTLVFRGRVLDDRNSNDRSLWRPAKREAWVYSEIGIGPDSIFSGEQCTTDGVFTFYVPPFFGSGRMSIVLNNRPVTDMGDRGDIAGHNYSYRRNYRPSYLLGRHVEPLNAYSPLPKNYDYYETSALSEPWDENLFSRAYMAMPVRNGRFVYYDPITGSYLVNEITKKARRNWSDFREVVPACVMDVDGLMTWLSNIYGDVSTFRWNPRLSLGFASYVPQDYQADRFFNEIATYENTTAGRHEVMHFGKYTYGSYAARNAFDLPNYTGLRELLYIFGLDGMNRTFVNADSVGGSPKYRGAIGLSDALPAGVDFFPHDENFRQLRLYADIDNRKLIYRAGRYREHVYTYNPKDDTGNDHPLTSIFNFITDKRYTDGSTLPEFMGYRIDFQGINRPVEFYCPDYSRMPLPEQTDYRRTVYWNPNVTTDASGHARVSFCNNGFSHRLAVSAEGLTPGGRAILRAD